MANKYNTSLALVHYTESIIHWLRTKAGFPQLALSVDVTGLATTHYGEPQSVNATDKGKMLNSTPFSDNAKGKFYGDASLNALKKLGQDTFGLVQLKKRKEEPQQEPKLKVVSGPVLADHAPDYVSSEEAATAEVWSEAEQLMRIGSWEYNVAIGTFTCTPGVHALLSVPRTTPLNDFVDFLPYLDAKDQDELHACWYQAEKLGKETSKVTRLRMATAEVWLELKVKPVFRNNNLVKLVGTMQDVSENKAKVDQLVKQKDEAEFATKMKSDFISLQSHEIRTPLNAIMGLTYLLMQDNNLAEEQKKHLHSIHFSSQNLLTLVNNTLAFSKMEAGKIELENVPFDIKDLMQNVHHSLMARTVEKKLQFELSVDPAIPAMVTGDPARLTQILNNLVSNAIKFTKRGSVKLAVDVVYSSEQDLVLDFSVADTGIGIPEDCHQLVFDSYVQASSSTHRKYGGTGLGLTITKKIVELHKGVIKLVSTPGVGSIFTVRIKYSKPKAEVATNTERQLPLGDNCDLQHKNILVIDDDSINCMVASKLLQTWKADVSIADNGKVALEKLKTNNFDAILMDLYMPTMDGFETITAIRKLGLKIPVIALTGSANQHERDRLLAMGVNDYIIKPYHPHQLHHKLTQLLKKS